MVCARRPSRRGHRLPGRAAPNRGRGMSNIIQPMTGNSENALRLHDIAETLARDIRQAGARLPREAAARLTQNVRAVVAQAMVGAVPHAAALALFLVILTNIVADLLAE